MTPSPALLLLLALVGRSSGQTVSLSCTQVPGALVQIDAGNGQVFGVNSAGMIYTLYSGSWTQLPGALTHVSVGAAGVWGVNRGNLIYKLVGAEWVQTQGLLKQVDAGGAQFISGANMNDDIFCLGNSATVSVKDGSALPWVNIEGKLKYYSCGPLGCWGVNSADDIYYRFGSTPSSCQGSSWQQVEGKLSMIEVGSDCSVYGVNSLGDMYRRNGISASNPLGSSWSQVTFGGRKFKHVSQDLGKLWVITTDQAIFKCQL
ncbi:fish-egg lectin-like isoform X3 [Ambystoma mexicanum]|uniref:fish-egg lectin-like isoform X3 n=1 Tax=Ambystoma mexicanum TaxID=8296 RepID=UPI0037E98267